MANEITLGYTTGATLYAVVTSSTGSYWNGTAFEGFVAGHWSTYAIALAEASGSGQYFGNFPAAGGGAYTVEIYAQAGGSPATTDGPPIATGQMQWNGTAEVPLSSLATFTAAQVATAVLTDTTSGDFATVGSLGWWLATFAKSLIYGTISGSITAGSFTINPTPNVPSQMLSANLAGLYVTVVSGVCQAAIGQIKTATINSPTSITVTLAASLSQSPSSGDQVFISS